MRQFIAIALLSLPASVLSQQAEHTISPGMTRAQVVAALGAPARQRSANGFTYLFYQNTCGRSCGMQDLVILQKDSVSDAIFRSPNRHYTGASSSPAEAPPSAAPRPARKPMTIRKDPVTTPAPTPTPAKATSQPAKAATPTQMKPPATANDVTPSIPKQTPLAPKPAPTAAPDKTPPG